MDEATKQALAVIDQTIEYLWENESYDRTLTLECAQTMVQDLRNNEQLGELELYLRRYTRMDPLEASAAAAEIFRQAL